MGVIAAGREIPSHDPEIGFAAWQDIAIRPARRVSISVGELAGEFGKQAVTIARNLQHFGARTGTGG